ncbi:lytic transglycosylase domain-containing protein [Sphingomonas immobilis]|uniref:Lytic transglycosylase domain-containing protein n=1 Tax=Sphingomonas immobilis TaxID=3063997 RepID=A0ABT9A099_9SPHN|nr:lytic transglycosylase domain-containing protein [Sphingomonas sp. CA1-15]MDO7842882.1 lytic transglycosylase domain-containing protein [Sphingomonas sp. CA1-15]
MAAATGVLVAAPAAGVPRDRAAEELLARCIARASIGKPWLSKTLWGLRDQEAGWVGAAVRNRNGSHDLGPLQINTWWVPRIASLLSRRKDHVRWWLQNDVCFNVDTASWIFRSALMTTKDYWKAVGLYHSPTGWRQERYAAAVARRLSLRFGPSIFARPDKP